MRPLFKNSNASASLYDTNLHSPGNDVATQTPTIPEMKDRQTLHTSIEKSSLPYDESPATGSSSELQSRDNAGTSTRWMLPVHIWKIILLAGLVSLPMIAFSVIILWIIFRHQIHPDTCPYPDLCMNSEQLNQTAASSHYIVDFPAARLVFIASWSSSVSFSMIGPLMAIFTFVVAQRWMRLSGSHQVKINPLPTPFQTGLLLRVLNADSLTLFEIGARKCRDVFWNKRVSPQYGISTPKVLQSSVLLFVIGLFGSLFVQGADTYLHITTNAIQWTKLVDNINSTKAYSHGLDTKCLNRQTFGSSYNPNYWGCNAAAMEIPIPPDNYTSWILVETSRMDEVALKQDVHGNMEIMDYVNDSGEHHAILGPKAVDSDLDWSASSFGVSTTCRPIANDACELSSTQMPRPYSDEHTPYAFFNCTKSRSGLNASGVIRNSSPQISFLDFHRFLDDIAPFANPHGASGSRFYDYEEAGRQAASLPDSENATVFANPWSWLSPPTTNGRVRDDNTTWQHPWLGDFLLLHCHTTVWDLNYTVIDQKMTNVTRRPSNSSTTGISSMSLSHVADFENWLDEIQDELNFCEDPAELVSRFEVSVNRKFILPFAGQVETRPAHAIQRRQTLLVSKVPKAAVWALVIANLLFVVLALGLAVLAVHASSEEVNQVQARMGIMGLSAHAFEYSSSKMKVKDESGLFEDRDGEKDRIVKRVGFDLTKQGGATYSLLERWEG